MESGPACGKHARGANQRHRHQRGESFWNRAAARRVQDASGDSGDGAASKGGGGNREEGANVALWPVLGAVGECGLDPNTFEHGLRTAPLLRIVIAVPPSAPGRQSQFIRRGLVGETAMCTGNPAKWKTETLSPRHRMSYRREASPNSRSSRPARHPDLSIQLRSMELSAQP